MKITGIKQQVKRPDRYSVYLDGRYAFSLSANELLNQGLRPNQELSAEDLAGLRADVTVDKALSRALDMISRRPRSQWELSHYLSRKGYSLTTIEIVMKRLSERGYVNDAEFARHWVASRRSLKPVSRRRLIQELKQKRVAEADIEAALSSDPAEERDVLKQLVARKRQQPRYQDDLRLMQYLARQGFSYDDIRQVLQDN